MTINMMTALDDRICAAVNNIKTTANEYPGVVIIQNLATQRLLYMSDRGLNILGANWEDMAKLTLEEYYIRFFNIEDLNDYAPKVFEYLEKNSPDDSVTFFQQVRSKDGNFRWYNTSIKILMQDDEGRPLLTIVFAVPIDPLESVKHKVDRLLEENTFLRDNYQKFSKLGDREKGVLKALALGKSSQEISAELFMSVATADTHRRNIKRKLGTQSLYELQQFARAFDLI
ncbi:LuxR C-terminal-related transcriptional regulator [Polluticoccus soli]|uniref:LuxR C-terminal-related transcriptional regulator n=1 Tax=Polluticoccus soli TaxID=3034150 RepID=UPI0023E2AD53|nr:LuxR C-terminal-related transcriptional regulator [Flavipsychrobacter sp. JY13-12]